MSNQQSNYGITAIAVRCLHTPRLGSHWRGTLLLQSLTAGSGDNCVQLLKSAQPNEFTSQKCFSDQSSRGLITGGARSNHGNIGKVQPNKRASTSGGSSNSESNSNTEPSFSEGKKTQPKRRMTSSVVTSNAAADLSSGTPALIATSFYYSIQGQVRHGDFPLCGELYVKTCYHHGADWMFCQGIEEGLSQLAVQSSSSSRELVWNFPLQSSWKSTNPHGWPRLVLSLYGSDGLGHDDVTFGYGSTLLPISSGHFIRSIPIYRPQSQSLLHKWTSWFTGRRPEFIDPKTVAFHEGRDVLRTETLGYVTVEFHTTFKDFQSLGYDSFTRPPTDTS